MLIRELRQTCLSKPRGCRQIRCERKINQRFGFNRMFTGKIFEANFIGS